MAVFSVEDKFFGVCCYLVVDLSKKRTDTFQNKSAPVFNLATDTSVILPNFKKSVYRCFGLDL